MTLIIMHSGQSGVERGVDRAARTVGFPVEGCCRTEQRDELGELPLEIRRDLTPCHQRGARSALRATLERSDALVVVVPNRAEANTYAGVEPLRRRARALGVPHWVVDQSTDLGEMIETLRAIEGDVRVMITGPRLTRWEQGERVGFLIVGQLSNSISPAATSQSISHLRQDA